MTSHEPPSPIIYIHVRSLHRVTESRHYYSPASTSDNQRAQALGVHAARYLITHGYTRSAIDTIIRFRDAVASRDEFALHLSQYGLPLAEGFYLWHLIQLT